MYVLVTGIHQPAYVMIDYAGFVATGSPLINIIMEVVPLIRALPAYWRK